MPTDHVLHNGEGLGGTLGTTPSPVRHGTVSCGLLVLSQRGLLMLTLEVYQQPDQLKYRQLIWQYLPISVQNSRRTDIATDIYLYGSYIGFHVAV